MAGAIRLNGRPLRIASKTLSPGATIEAHIDVARLFEDSTSRDKTFELTIDRILFEDDDLIVVDKPACFPSQPTVDQVRDNLFAAVNRFLARREGVPKTYVGAHQRLDRDTSGVVLFTKSQRVNAAVSEIFSKHQGIKIYQALTMPRRNSRSSSIKKEWNVRNHLGKISSKSKRAKYGAVDADGDFAETSFRVLGEYPRGNWIEAIPKTGRTHQIRIHLSEYGFPILGDDLYGAGHGAQERNGEMPRMMLHAAELIFPHPITGQEVSVESPLPPDFQKCLNWIKRHE